MNDLYDPDKAAFHEFWVQVGQRWVATVAITKIGASLAVRREHGQPGVVLGIEDAKHHSPVPFVNVLD